MFPDLSTIEFNSPQEGKAFTVLVEHSGAGITDRRSSVKMQEWDACVDCPVYDRCYNLCVAKMLLHLAAQGYGIARAF
jgi:hypothetical protein